MVSLSEESVRAWIVVFFLRSSVVPLPSALPHQLGDLVSVDSCASANLHSLAQSIELTTAGNVKEVDLGLLG